MSNYNSQQAGSLNPASLSPRRVAKLIQLKKVQTKQQIIKIHLVLHARKAGLLRQNTIQEIKMQQISTSKRLMMVVQLRAEEEEELLRRKEDHLSRVLKMSLQI